jgi:hypothetical protein
MPYATSHVRREPASARSAGAPLWSGTPFALRRWPHRWRQRDDLPHPILDASLEEADCSQDVDVGVEIRLPDRAPDICVGRPVAECLRPEVFEDLGTPGADVCLVEVCPLGDVLALAAREVADYGHLWWRPRRRLAHVRANEPGSSVSNTLISGGTTGQLPSHRLGLLLGLYTPGVLAYDRRPVLRVGQRGSPLDPTDPTPTPTLNAPAETNRR